MRVRAIAVVALSFLPGCFSVPHYDAASEERIRELVRRTNEVVADGDRGRLALANSQQFLRQSQAQVHVLRIRSAQSYMSKEALAAMDLLEREYEALLKRNRPLRSRETSNLRITLFALQELKPVVPIARRVAALAGTDNSSSDPFEDNNDSTRNQCDDKKKHDHHGDDCPARKR